MKMDSKVKMLAELKCQMVCFMICMSRYHAKKLHYTWCKHIFLCAVWGGGGCLFPTGARAPVRSKAAATEWVRGLYWNGGGAGGHREGLRSRGIKHLVQKIER